MKNFKAMVAFMLAITGLKELPIADSKVAFTDEQNAKLDAALQEKLGAQFTLEKVVSAMNQELAAAAAAEEANNDAELVDLRAEARQMLKAHNLSAEEEEAILQNPQGSNAEIKAMLSGLIAHNKEMDKTLQKLIKDPEGDNPIDVANALKQGKLIHSQTHLFASNKEIDAFDGRNWNKRAAGLTTSATDFSDQVQVDKLNGDLEFYHRENPDEIKSLIRDNFGLPAFWPKRFGVHDRVTSASIVTGPVTQARKLPWLANNKQKIEAEVGYIYPAQIDAEWEGHNLQKIETSWLNSFNREGSQAYKMSFVRFLVGELMKQARIEDRISSVKGVHVATPDDATVAGRFINRMNGLIYQFWKHKNVTKKYKAFSIGNPTTANIVDYVDNIVKRLPDDVRNMPGVKFYANPDWFQAYKRRYETIYGGNSDYTGYPKNPKDYDNIEFVPLIDLTGSDFMFVTFEDNIEILENIPAEKSLFTFEKMLRKVYAFADYKLGIWLKHVGVKVKDGDPLEFQVQSVWSNDVPMFKPDFFIPAYDDETGILKATFSNIYVAKGWATNITKIEDAYEGQIIKIKGATSGVSGLVATASADLDLTADFDLSTGGTLTLIADGVGGATEIKRTAGPSELPSTTVNFDDTAIDADAGTVFQFTGAAPKTLTEILNGVEDQQITIKGKAAVALTIASVEGHITVGASRQLDTADDYVTFVKVDGQWYEIDFNIEA